MIGIRLFNAASSPLPHATSKLLILLACQACF